MRITLAIAFATIVAGISSSAMSRMEADSLVASGLRAYAAGDHAAAQVALDSVAHEFNSAALQFDLGNCWFKLGDVSRAILHYERGLLLQPGDADLLANLALANDQVKDRLASDGGPVLGATWARFRGGDDPDQWSRRALFASLLFFALLSAAMLIKGRTPRRAAGILASGAFIVLLICIGFASMRHDELIRSEHAIIMAPKVEVRSEPRTGTKVLFVLHKGTKVAVDQDAEGWTEVRLPSGIVGWMPTGSLERI
ncbi:MAG: SH3 domain-containing protein [Flavobacteriales bacterium]|nr:SH3 domain-containing protein [Flavobacteriales bacterium]MCC6939882.1 SH3 domain-containing protein [Flavobacteriales bacterium]